MKFSKSEWCPRQDLKLFVPKRQKRANHADISDSIGCILILGKCPKMPNRTLKSGKVVLYSTVKKQALTTGTRPVFRTIIDWRPCAERTRAGGQNSIGKAAAKNRGCRRGISGYVAGVNWQTVVSLVIVTLAVAGLLWGWLRRRKFSFARDTHCGCSAAQHSPNTSSIIFHARKGERPQIIVKSK